MKRIKSVTTVHDEYVIKTVRKHELHMKNACRIYSADSEKQLQSFMKEKGLI